jgi:choline dehydrogenase-like flavoprotein
VTVTGTDVVVIGSGPCGAMAMTELLAAGLDVTMLDAGSRPVRGAIVRARGQTLFRWAQGGGLRWDRHVSSGDPSTQWGSSFSLGGLSNYWTSAVPRMHPDDFVEGAALGEQFRWPITYSDLEPFYDQVERLMLITSGHSIDGVPRGVAAFAAPPSGEWQAFLEAAAHHGVGTLPMAKGRPWMVALRATAFTSYHCLVKPALDSPQLHLVTGAVALRIDVSSGGASVEYLDRASGGRRVVRCRAVVVAAGPLDSTKIMLQSRSGDFPGGLGNSSGMVGRYLHDHPRQWWPVRLERAMPVLTHPLYIPRAPVETSPPLVASSLTLGMVGTTTRVKGWCGVKSDLVGVQVFGTMVPSPAATVRLAESGDGDPVNSRLDVDIQYDAAARDNMAQARDRLVEVFRDGGVKADPVEPFHDVHPGSSFHYGGTLRMHADPAYGVLDAWNRVHDAPNVIVCDASCFTTGPEKNPTLTAMAIAARAARRLSADLGARGSPSTVASSAGPQES